MRGGWGRGFPPFLRLGLRLTLTKDAPEVPSRTLVGSVRVIASPLTVEAPPRVLHPWFPLGESPQPRRNPILCDTLYPTPFESVGPSVRTDLYLCETRGHERLCDC